MYNFNDMFNAIELILSGFPLAGEKIGTDTFDNGEAHVFIDTYFANDTAKYETAIKVNNDDLVVVEEYNNSDEAQAGHQKWIEICKRNTFYFHSIQTGEMFMYRV